MRFSGALRGVALALVASLAACSPESAGAPWQEARIPAAAVPQAYFTAWNTAENRETCSLIAFSDAAATRRGTARVATFSGGWGVAYDQADLRSAFGVAGTGVKAADPMYDEWPHKVTWPDSSSAGYGPEGGTGPNQLAYLTIAGQACLYNVWSRLGQEHLEQLLGTLRFVEVAGS